VVSPRQDGAIGAIRSGVFRIIRPKRKTPAYIGKGHKKSKRVAIKPPAPPKRKTKRASPRRKTKRRS
jgi:hypothetical protein